MIWNPNNLLNLTKIMLKDSIGKVGWNIQHRKRLEKRRRTVHSTV